MYLLAVQVQTTLHVVTAGSKSVVMNFNAAKGDDTDGNCGTVLGQ